MTISSQTRRAGPFAGNGVATIFTFAFKVFETDDVLVTLLTLATGVEETLVLNTHYTVALNADQNNNPGGTVTYPISGSPMASTHTLTLTSRIEQTQETDIVNAGGFFPEVIEDSLDKNLAIIQQETERLDRAIVLPVSDNNPVVVLPTAAVRALKFLGFDSSGNPIAAVLGTTALTVSSYIETLLDDSNAATARATLGALGSVNGYPAEADVVEGDFALIHDTSEGTDNKAKVQDLFNAIGGMTALSGVIDIDADTLVVHDASQSAPKQRKVPARIAQVPVRQTALIGNTDANGYANFITTGAGLRPGLLATAVALALTSAAGYDDLGEKNYYERLTADASDILGADLSASNTSFLYRDLASAWGKTLVPPQYGYAFDRTQNALLHFDGTDAATTTTDDFGNTWTFAGNAQLDTAQFKFGSASLLLDGTGDYVESTDFKSLGGDSWELSAWFRANATSAFHAITSAENAGGFGALIDVDHNAGARRVRAILSSDGTSNDIGSIVGVTTTVALATWYKVRLVFDALAGNYKLYLSNNGAAESLEGTISSTARICAVTKLRHGFTALAGISAWNGWLDEFRLIRCATVTAAETPKASAFVVNEANQLVNFFSIPEMKMYDVTSASASAGVNPGLTLRNRVFVGEADTSGAAVTAVRSYALRGEYVSPTAAMIGISTSATLNHLIGVVPLKRDLFAVCNTAEDGYIPGDVVTHMATFASAAFAVPHPIRATRTALSFSTSSGNDLYTVPKGGGALVAIATGWSYLVRASRGW